MPQPVVKNRLVAMAYGDFILHRDLKTFLASFSCSAFDLAAGKKILNISKFSRGTRLGSHLPPGSR